MNLPSFRPVFSVKNQCAPECVPSIPSISHIKNTKKKRESRPRHSCSSISFCALPSFCRRNRNRTQTLGAIPCESITGFQSFFRRRRSLNSTFFSSFFLFFPSSLLFLFRSSFFGWHRSGTLFPGSPSSRRSYSFVSTFFLFSF